MKRNDLVEIKKGNVGTGLLIENDGYISLHEEKNKLIKEDIDAHRDNGWYCPYPFRLFCVLQKYDIKNANGRIYPREILMREVEKYQERIRNRSSFGECYTPDTLILTQEGWKQLCELKEGESILTLNTNTNVMEYQNITRIIKKHHTGKMIRLKGRNIDDLVTPNHQFPLYDENCKFYQNISAQEIFDNYQTDNNKLLNYYIPNHSSSTESGIDCGALTLSEEDYDGEVMCVEVPNHVWYCMCNNKCHWTHNCNHPSESVISLDRISHLITECHWEGQTLVGEIELNVSQGFVKEGIVSTQGDVVANLILNGYKIGVSSRAIGGVENRGGIMYVDDTLELICWDCVADPSTPSAYIVKEPHELQPYVESKDKKGNMLSEKISRVKNLL